MQEILKDDLMCAGQCDKLRLKDENEAAIAIIQHGKCYNRGKLKSVLWTNNIGKVRLVGEMN